MWQNMGRIAAGGSVFSIHANQAEQIWLATGAGLLQRAPTGWQPLDQSQPLPLIVALASSPAGEVWWAAGMNGGVVRSRSAGRRWEMCWLDQIAEPVVCFAVSPRYQADRTVLAGTNGAGVLRSTDGGRRWFLSNFGLQDFTVLALTPATDWSRREILFAGTLAGVYRSSGGGRAWKLAGLSEFAIQTVAASRQFAQNGLILAGADGHGIYRSADGGKSWQAAGENLPPGCSVNTLINYQHQGHEYWLAGTGDRGLWLSSDGGIQWQKILTAAQPVLSLAASPEMLLAGLSDSGLLTSTDGGQSWQTGKPIQARGWQRVVKAGESRLLAIAPTDGVWMSGDGGHMWQRAIEASPNRLLLAVAVVGQAWLAAWLDGLWRKVAEQDWQPVLSQQDTPVVALAAGESPGQPVWAAATDCRLWQSPDAGQSWQPVDETPFAGQQLLALALTPEDDTLLAGSVQPQSGELTLWRRQAGEGEWEAWLRRPVSQPYIQVLPQGPGAEQSWLIVDKEVWRHTGAGWQLVKAFEQTVRRVAQDVAGERLYLLVGREIFCGGAGNDWLTLAAPPEAAPLVDLQVVGRARLLVLDVTGALWQAAPG